MNTAAGSQETVGKSSLDYLRFEALSLEALRLIRSRKQCNKAECEQLETQIADLKETTKKAVINRRSSASRR